MRPGNRRRDGQCAWPIRLGNSPSTWSGEASGGSCVGELTNVISACIQHRMTAYKVSLFQMGTHPALCTSPIDYQIVNAAEEAVTKLKQAIKMTVIARNSVLQTG